MKSLFKSRKGMSGVAIGSVIILTLAFIVASVSYIMPTLAAHLNSAEIQPEWSPSGDTIDYSVEICNVPDGGDEIDEVRIYETTGYTIVIAEDKTGWYKSPYNPVKKYYQYTALDSSNYIDEGECTTFYFTATTPSTPYCNLEWKFETRDVNDVWKFAYDYTSIDDKEPVLTKEVEGLNDGPCPPGVGEECWISTETMTRIKVSVLDEGNCGVSGLDYCKITYTIDGGDPIEEVYADLDGDTTWSHDVTFGEDSLHILTVECKDIAGNLLLDSENFRVDGTPPVTTKQFNGPQKIDGNVEWIDGVTTVTLNPTDPDPSGYSCNIGVDKTWYYNIMACGDDSCNAPLEFCQAIVPSPYSDPETKYCIDKAQDVCTEEPYSFDPETQFNDWADCVEDLAKDDGWCNVPLDDEWYLYRGTPIEKDQESCHILQFFSVDHLGNVENMNVNCFFVDKTPPFMDNDNGDAIWDDGESLFMTDDNPDGEFHWISSSMPITFKCDDTMTPTGEPQAHPSESEKLCFKVSYDYPEWGYITDRYCSGGTMNAENYCCVPVDGNKKYNFYFNSDEESLHNLEYYCIDAVEKKTDVHVQYYKVDDTPPSITKTMLGTDHLAKVGTCPPTSPSDECYVKDGGANGVRVDVTDGGDVCAVDDPACPWELWWDATEEECTIAGGYSWNEIDGCLIQAGQLNKNGFDIYFTEDSTHTLIVNCFDDLGNDMVEDVEVFYVDSTPPVTTKTYGDPTKQECAYRWITSDTEITLDAVDAKVGVDKTYYKVTQLDIPDDQCVEECDITNNIADGMREYTGPFKIGEDSCHFIEYYSVDRLGNEETVKTQCVFVDNTPPEGIKIVGTPSIPGEGSGDSVTIIKEVTTGELAVADPEIYFLVDTTGSMGSAISPVKTNINTILSSVEAKFGAGDYKDFPYDDHAFDNGQSITSDEPSVAAAINAMSASGGSDGSEGQLYALHRIAQNDVGYSADSTKIIVWFGDAPGHDPVCSAISGEGSDITEASVTAELTDAGIIVIAISTTTGYMSGLDDNPSSSASDYSGYCSIDGSSGQATRIADATGGVHLTDVSSGEIVTAIIDAIGEVTGTTDVVPDASDCEAQGLEVTFSPLKHEDVGPLETVVFDETLELADGTLPGTEIVCDINFRSGAMGGIIATERVYVNSDNTPESPMPGSGSVVPEIVDIELGSGGGVDWYVTKNTPIYLSCDDSWDGTVPHPVGQETIYWRFSSYVDGFDGDPTYDPEVGWNSQLYLGTPVEVNFPEDCWHDLEFYCVDHLGNEGNVDREYFIVETVPPVIDKTVTGPQLECLDGLRVLDGPIEDCYMVDSATEVTIDAHDPDPHPVNEVTCDWWYEWGGDVWHAEFDGEWIRVGGKAEDITVPFSFHFPEESEHILHVYCEDALQNWVDDAEMFIVDKTPPLITKEYGDPFYQECLNWDWVSKGCCGGHWECSEWGAEWISSATPIQITVTDDGPHPTGIKETKYRYKLVSDDYCWGNLDCQDASAEGATWNTLADPTQGEFYIPESSCHVIEIMSTDNVEKSSTHKQCAFVDNDGPEPEKTIGEPKDEWYPGEEGEPVSYFYPDETANCWTGTEGSIECWEATTLTPIIMNCDDSWDGTDTHPVGDKKVCFKVDVDGEDETLRYCMEYHGIYNWKTEECCKWVMPGEEEEDLDGCDDFRGAYICDDPQDIECYNKNRLFYFLEETEHNLQYYCVDKLGNVGPVDDEKFKIEGNKFEIPLFKKWNLISVPFTLLNDDPEAIFNKVYYDGDQITDNISQFIDSVWTYDPDHVICGQDWCVWTPGTEAPDNLRIKPGWGYWVLVKEKPIGCEEVDGCCGFLGGCFWKSEEPLWLILGGSLFSPATTPPSRNLVKGWNLVGYYGTKWEEYDWGDFDFMCGDSLNFEEKTLYGEPVYCALNSLVDTSEGYPRWESLWSYINCGNHYTDWLGLNACYYPSDYVAQDRMYAGRGYWLMMDVEDIYAPATNCIWNSDYVCLLSSGSPLLA